MKNYLKRVFNYGPDVWMDDHQCGCVDAPSSNDSESDDSDNDN